MKQRKVLLVDLNMFFGGGQVYLECLTRLLEDKVQFYAFSINPKLMRSLGQMGVKSFGFEAIVNWGKPIHIVTAFFFMVYVRVRYGVDTIWVNGIPDIVLLPFARLLGCQTVATRHLTLEIETLGFYRGVKRRVAELFYRISAFAAQKIICVSRPVADDLAQIAPPEKLAVIPNWQPKLPEPVRHNANLSEPLRLLYVGRLQKYKGASLILDAMRELNASSNGGKEVSLTIVGEGRYRDELELEAVGLNVTFTGFQDDPTQFYRATDVFVNPTIGPEGMPLVSLEAMSYGLPCIFSDLQVHREITDNGHFAMLFRSGESQDLVSKIDQFLSSRDLLQEYGHRARSVIERRHTSAVARAHYIQEIQL